MFDLVMSLNSLLVTPRCVGCRTLGTDLCDACKSSVTLSTKSTHLVKKLHLNSLVCIGPYDGWLRQSLITYKNGDRSCATGLGELIRIGLTTLPDALVIPIPTTAGKLRERGFDTLGDIVDHALVGTSHSRGSGGLAINNHVLDQVGLTYVQRQHNLQNAVKALRLMPARVCLVDDVVTTGATLASAAQAVRKAGAQTVYAVTLCDATKSGYR